MRPIRWCSDHVELLDQTLLPDRETWLELRTVEEVAEAIRSMKIRGAPAIGIAAAYGVALAALNSRATTAGEALAELSEASRLLAGTRPTAVNLFWALERMDRAAREDSAEPLPGRLVQAALELHEEDVRMCQEIGRHGAGLIPPGSRVLTHCNAGALATGDHGTALGVIRTAHEQGRIARVWVDETRPFLQGSRLTAWELTREGIPCRLICDNMAGHFMQRGEIDMVVVGADRITAQGDVANKIGTYTLAVLCREHGLPFYVAAPSSTFDMTLQEGARIPIEERDPEEVTHLRGLRLAPEGVEAAHPAFDVTPHRLVTGLITERGVVRPPFAAALKGSLSPVR